MNEQADRQAAIYARVSTEDQVDGTSLDTQLERCRAHVLGRGWNLAGEFVDEGVSGSLSSRPALDKLIAEVRAGHIHVVVVAKLDRFGRSVRHLSSLLGELDDLRVEFVSLSEAIDSSTPVGRLQRTLLASFAEFERDRIRERTSEGILAVAREGYWPSGEPPFGLWTVPDGRRRRVVIQQAEAAAINHAVECIVERGMSTWETAASLNALELRPRKSARWTGANLRSVLLNGSALSGRWIWSKGREGETAIDVPAILSPEQHEALMAALARTRRATPYRKHFYLLGGGRITSPCGGRMQGWTSDGVGPSAPVYKCPLSWASVPKDERCGCQTLRRDTIDDAVWAEVVRLLSRPEVLMAGAQEALDLTAAGRELGGEDLAALDRRIGRLERAAGEKVAKLLADGLDPVVAQHAASALTADLTGLRDHRSKVASWARANADRASRAERLWQLAARAAEVLAEPSDELRHQVIDALEVRVALGGWRPCEPCGGSGYVPATFEGPRLKGQPRRLICPTCHRTGRSPIWSMTGEVPETLLAPPERPEQPQQGWPFRVVSAATGA
jgi:site-specific DNA recombinase